MTESESGIENETEKILLVGKARECLEDAENAPGAGRGTRNARGNGKGTENTETDIADLVSFPLICTHSFSSIGLFHYLASVSLSVPLLGFLRRRIIFLFYEVHQDHNKTAQKFLHVKACREPYWLVSVSHATSFSLLD